MKLSISVLLLIPQVPVLAFVHLNRPFLSSSMIFSKDELLMQVGSISPTQQRVLSSMSLQAAPRRLDDNVDGPLYVNNQCINCAACSMFAPDVFSRSKQDDAHVVHKQPETEYEIETARAALAACPVAAIRVETSAQRSHRNQEKLSTTQEELVKQLAINPKFNGRPFPFPRRISDHVPDVYFLGHHNSKSFGATPYLLKTEQHGWIMVDSPKYSKSAVQAIESLTGKDSGPSYLMITHVDDSAGHNDWKNHYPNLKRIFHAGDLGRYNWIGDKTLEQVEILLQERSSPSTTTTTTRTTTNQPLKMFTLPTGEPINDSMLLEDQEVVLIHTPGHSPGSVTLWKRPTTNGSPGVLFTGDTYSFTTRHGGHMTGFPRYGNNLRQQSQTLPKLLQLDWQVIAPGHGHVRDYRTMMKRNTSIADEPNNENENDDDERASDMQPAIQELLHY